MADLKKLQEDYFKRVGRNVVEYKYIEKLLKVLLPISEAFANCGKSNPSKFELATLGHLINKLIEYLETNADFLEVEGHDDFNTLESLKELFYDDFRKLVQARNNLVHYSGSLPCSEEKYQVQIKELDINYDNIFSFKSNLVRMIFVHNALINSFLGYEDSKAYATYLILKESLPENTVFIDFVNPWQTTWYKTKIIEYTLIAEKKFKNQYGWTSLSHAGNFIRQSDKNITPRRYGLSKLKDVLEASGLFDFYFIENKKQLFYKSTYSCVNWAFERNLEEYTVHVK
ncbi:OST-HTH/LOTUS domain-containing protein [[Limnothrix rosea] IAM M-220]|uniref:OST-HTH/LOTUS domain-containing protein n=1 Tax=[Limnothrix rosea] IAM M-220 TaxID=454133 RepID=UPI0009631A17|nr:OST-HTH/LOTUS domain-containing protein [[Limnothrix rosea] IAM M-220]OKH19972.1 hypothetical protein NIES208_00395 [[Limnothrix rosea] IAM M-220]